MRIPPNASEAKRFSMTMKNQLSQVGEVVLAFEGFARESEIPGEATQKVKLAFDELLNNIVSYGFPEGGEHEINLSVQCMEERLKITVIDGGVPFNPFQMATPDLQNSLEDAPIGRLGIHLVRELMDEVSYKRGVTKIS